MDRKTLIHEFVRRYGDGPEPKTVRAPGRVNLLGGHVDYHDGLVMPVAVEKDSYAAVRCNASRNISAASSNMDLDVSFEAGMIDRGDAGWGEYIKGVLWALDKMGKSVTGAEIYIHGDIPIGSGLSSSAALEAVITLGISEACGFGLSDNEIINVSYEAETGFVGVPCGVMDQTAVMSCREGYVMLLDCRTGEAIDLPLPRHARLVIIDTLLRRSLVDSRFAERREEAETGLNLLSELSPNLTSLRDLDLQGFAVLSGVLDDVKRRRVRHVVTEIQRVRDGAHALSQGDLHELGRLMFESHESSRVNYEVSCPELDFIVDAANKSEGVYGARLTGAGFGGCAVVLVNADAAHRFSEEVFDSYERKFNVQPEIFITGAAEGASLLD